MTSAGVARLVSGFTQDLEDFSFVSTVFTLSHFILCSLFVQTMFILTQLIVLRSKLLSFWANYVYFEQLLYILEISWRLCLKCLGWSFMDLTRIQKSFKIDYSFIITNTCFPNYKRMYQIKILIQLR